MKLLPSILLLSLISLAFTSLTLICDDVLKIPVDTQYQYSLSATGGKSPYSFSATGLPAGVTISGGAIIGISKVVGVFPVVISVSDGDQTAANKHIFVYVTGPTTGSSAGGASSQTTTVTTTTRTVGSGAGGVLPVENRGQQNLQTGSQSFQSSSSSSQQSGAGYVGGNIIGNSGIGSSQYPSSYSSNNQQYTINGISTNSVYPQNLQTGSVTFDLQNNNNYQQQIPSQYSANPNSNPTIVTSNPLIVSTTTPYITNYSFASSLQSTPTITSTQSV